MADLESSPLLGSRGSDNHYDDENSYDNYKPRRSQSFWRRLLAYSIVGLSLLGVYQLVFLARTSLTRDLRHIHGSAFTSQEIERHIVKAVEASSISDFADSIFQSDSHLAGENEELVLWFLEKFEKFGLSDAFVENYDVWLNYPLSHRVALIDAKTDEVLEELSLEEDVLEDDPLTGRKDRNPTFHGYSASGNATGKLVYANFGRKQDYDELVALGIDLTDKVVLVRYGGVFRGLKVKLAEELGASAVLIYSDPAEDGDITEANGYKAYPDGPARNPSAVQRGSVQDLAHSPGDPTTPGYASKPGVPREDPQGIPGIPSIPISYKDALPLLKALNGHGETPKGWKGALDGVDYSIGPTKHTVVNVHNEQDYKFRTIRNVVGKIPGIIGEEVIIGNHRDAWVLGASDPNSGSIVFLELVRVFGELAKLGWKPYRTLVFKSWDGEEYGLLGSTESGEDHSAHHHTTALAYLNTDVAWTGPHLNVDASPLLTDVIVRATKLVDWPLKGEKSLYDQWTKEAGGPVIHPLGSGSDFTVFQDHLGIPSVDFGFHGNGSDAVYHYHSNYDSLHWLKTYSDPKLEGHATAARFLGLLAAQLVEPGVTKFTYAPYAEEIHSYLSKYLDSEALNVFGEDAEMLSLAHKTLKHAKEFVDESRHYDAYLDELSEEAKIDHPWWSFWEKLQLWRKIRKANDRSLMFDRFFVYKEGLDNRPWFRHIVYAPGRYTGYAGQVLPGIAESLEDKDVENLKKWLEVTAFSLKHAIAFVR